MLFEHGGLDEHRERTPEARVKDEDLLPADLRHNEGGNKEERPISSGAGETTRLGSVSLCTGNVTGGPYAHCDGDAPRPGPPEVPASAHPWSVGLCKARQQANECHTRIEQSAKFRDFTTADVVPRYPSLAACTSHLIAVMSTGPPAMSGTAFAMAARSEHCFLPYHLSEPFMARRFAIAPGITASAYAKLRSSMPPRDRSGRRGLNWITLDSASQAFGLGARSPQAATHAAARPTRQAIRGTSQFKPSRQSISVERAHVEDGSRASGSTPPR